MAIAFEQTMAAFYGMYADCTTLWPQYDFAKMGLKGDTSTYGDLISIACGHKASRAQRRCHKAQSKNEDKATKRVSVVFLCVHYKPLEKLFMLLLGQRSKAMP